MNHTFSPRRLGSFLLFLALTALAAPGRSADTPDEKVKKVEIKKVDLSRLKNDELLKEARGILDKAWGEYLASVRSLDSAGLLLEDASRDDEPKKEAKKKEPEKAGLTVEEAKNLAETARQKLKRVRVQKELLDRIASANDTVQSASVALQNALDDLKPYSIELNLRVEDGTLSVDAPPDLTSEALAKRRKEIDDARAKRKEKLADTRKALEAIAGELEAAAKALSAAEAEVVQAGKTLAQEQKRQEMEKGYAGKTPETLLADLARLVEEGDGLKGSYELALARFREQFAESDRLRKAFTSLKPPEVAIPQLARAEDVEVAAKAIQELIAFYTARVQSAEELRTSQASLVKQGGEFEADAAVSYEHLFKMRVVAGLLSKAGVDESKYPDGGQPSRVEAAAEKQSKSAAEVQAGSETAKAEIAELDKQLAEARLAGESARKQLQGLKQSQQVTTAVLKWEEQLRGLAPAQLSDLFTRTRKDLEAKLSLLQGDETAFRKSLATTTEIRAKLDGLKDPLLRKAEEEGQGERLKILGELRKEAGLDRAAKEVVPEPKKDDPAKPEKKTDEKEPKKAEPDKRSEIEKITETVASFQQTLAARVRVLDEREEKAKELLAALDELQKTATVYQNALTESRRIALQLNAAASEIKKRVGKGELSGGQIPPGITDALRGELRSKLEADSAATLTALTEVERDRELLRRPDPDADALKLASKELLGYVGGRIDLLSDLKKLSEDYRTPKKDRPPSEVKRLEQLAADRQSDDAGPNDWLLSIDSSKAAKGLVELLTTYYQELIEIEEKNDNLLKRKAKIDELVELTRKETASVAKILPLIEKQIGQLQTAQEEEFLLARARLKPDQADELLKAYQTKSGKLLAKPVPFGDKEKSDKVDELGGVLFERLVRSEAARLWGSTLGGRLSPTGIKTEAGVYQDEAARTNALRSANGRRIASLTGVEPPDPSKPPADPAEAPAPPVRISGGEIGKTRLELSDIRTEGVKLIAIKLGAILLMAFLMPRLAMWVLRRAMGGSDESGLVLTAIGAFVKAAIWVAAFAMILSVMGFDVTAIIAGLGIGGLAIGLAAQPMISDVIAAMIIFAERKFSIGDVIRLGTGDPARVIGLSWRSTQLRNQDGLTVNMPNRKITDSAVQNLTKNGRTYDTLAVNITTDRDAGTVLETIRRVLDECEHLTADHGVSVSEYTRKGEVTEVKYQFWWFLTNYEKRSQTRDVVFKRVGRALEEQNMKGTEVTLA